MTVQAQILDLLQTQQRERFMAMILVTHDLQLVARAWPTSIVVMYAGRIVERAPTRELFADMHMPYTEALLHGRSPRSTNPATPDFLVIQGRPPDLVRIAPGCRFAPRCPVRT